MILIVEDNAGKAARVREVLEQAGVDSARIDVAVDLRSARDMLANRTYRGLVLDLNIPTVFSRPPDPKHGIQLLREVTDAGSRGPVEYIVGLTERLDMVAAHAEPFQKAILGLVGYGPDGRWKEVIAHLARAVLVRTSVANTTADVLIHTALQKPELRAVSQVLGLTPVSEYSPSGRPYFSGEVALGDAALQVVAVSSFQMGMPAASVEVCAAMNRFRPSIVLHVGICGGVRGKVSLGDIIVADPCFDYGSGKWVEKETGKTRHFRPDPRQERVPTATLPILAALEGNRSWRLEAMDAWNGKEATLPTIHVGPFASGAAVVASNQVLKEVGTDPARKLLGIDMEAYGVYVAALRGAHPATHFASMKGVSDFADATKDDGGRDWAAFIAAQAAKAYLLEYLRQNQ